MVAAERFAIRESAGRCHGRKLFWHFPTWWMESRRGKESGQFSAVGERSGPEATVKLSFLVSYRVSKITRHILRGTVEEFQQRDHQPILHLRHHVLRVHQKVCCIVPTRAEATASDTENQAHKSSRYEQCRITSRSRPGIYGQ